MMQDHASRKSFWRDLPRPFFCLAPMADVTDAATRRIVAKYSKHGTKDGGPDVFWTEFVSADGLMMGGREALIRDLEYSEDERPIVAQLFTSNPDNMREAAKLCASLGFDGIDINMGCPDRAIARQMCGAEIIKYPELAAQVIQAAKEGAPNLPISVKTRIGYLKPDIDGWIRHLLNQDIAALTVHARTRKELSKVPARWEFVKEVVMLRNEIAKETLIIGNGDVHTLNEGYERVKETGCDGVMIGRAIFGNPWFFDKNIGVKKSGKYLGRFLGSILPRNWVKKIEGDDRYTVANISIKERLEVMIEHSRLFEKHLGDIKGFHIMKKHFKAYTSSFKGAKELRVRLMEECQNSDDVERVVKDFLSNREF